MKALAISLLTNHAPAIAAVLVTLLLGLATSVANGLLKYPATESLGHAILDRLSLLARSDSPGTFKALGKRSKKPQAQS